MNGESAAGFELHTTPEEPATELAVLMRSEFLADRRAMPRNGIIRMARSAGTTAAPGTRQTLTIGRFARLCRLSVKQLRRYDEMGLSAPVRGQQLRLPPLHARTGT